MSDRPRDEGPRRRPLPKGGATRPVGEPQHTASQPPIRRPRQSGGRNANQWGAARPPSSHPSRGCRAVGVGGHGMTVDGERMPRPERPFHSENATETAGRDSKLLAWSPARGGGSGASIFKLRCETKFVAIVTFSHTGGLPRGIFEPCCKRALARCRRKHADSWT